MHPCLKPLVPALALLVFATASRHAAAQSCAVALPDSVAACDNAVAPVDWEAWGVDTAEWIGVAWWTESGATDSTGTSSGPTLNEPGWWNFAWYGAAGDTCTDSVFVEVLTGPVAAFTAAGGECANAGTPFTNTSTGGIGTVYSWNFGGAAPGTSATSPTVTFPGLTGAGTATVTATLTAANGDGSCPDATSAAVTVLQIPQPIFTEAPPLCQSDVNWPNYELVLPPYPAATSWHIDWGNGLDTAFSAPSFVSPPGTVYAGFGLFDITLTVEGLNGCSNTMVEEVFVGSNPTIGTANPGNTVGLCTPADLVFPITEFENNVVGTTYTIEFGDGAAVVYNHPPPAEVFHTYQDDSCGEMTPEGSGNALRFKVTASNGCGTSISTHDPIRLHRSPDPQLAGPTLVCTGVYDYAVSGNGLEVTAEDCEDSDVYWSVEALEGTGSAFASPGIGTSSSVAFTEPGLYAVSVYDLHTFCEDGQDTLEVCAIPPPMADAVPSGVEGCAPFQVDFSGTSQSPVACGNYVYTWSVDGGSFGFTNGTTSSSPSPSVVLNDPGTYTITQTVEAPGVNCPVSSTTHVIDVYVEPSITISNGGFACEGDEWTLAVLDFDTGGDPGSSFYWIVDGASVYSPIDEVLAVDLDDDGIWVANAYLTNFCGIGSDQSAMFVNDTPDLEISAPSSACVGDVQEVVVSGADNYAWSPAPDVLFPGNDEAEYAVTSGQWVVITGTYTYPQFNCNASDSVYLEVTPLPVISFPSVGDVCAGSPFAPAASVSSGTPDYAFSWVYGTEVAAGPSPQFTAAAGASAVQLAVTDALGCSDVAAASVNVLALPVVEAGVLDGFCDQSIDTLLTSGSPLGGTWSGPGISPAGLLNPATLGVGTWSATYTYTDANGCANSDDLTIEVFAPLFADAGPDGSWCNLDTLVAFADYFPGSQGTWSGPGVVNGASGTVDLGALAPGSHAFTYTYGTGTCATSDERLVTILPNPQPTISASDDTVCDGDPVTASVSASGGTGDYTFSMAGAGWTVVAPDAATTVVSSGTPATLFATATDGNGCVGYDTLDIQVLALPSLAVTDTLSACDQPIVEQLPDPQPPGGQWSGPGVVDPIGVFNPALAGEGTIPLVYTYTDGAGCTNALSTVALVAAPIPAVAGPGAAVCDENVFEQLEGFSPEGGAWSGPGLLPGGAWNAGPLGPGAYTATYTYGTGSCATSAATTLTVHERPAVDITGPATSCIGDSVMYSVTVSGGVPPYTIAWVTPTGTSASALPTAPGEFLVQVSVTDANGCLEGAVFTTVVQDLPVVDAGADLTLCDQPIEEQLIGASPIGGIYSGSPAVAAEGWFNPAVSGTGPHVVVYTYTDPLTGCTAADSLVVEVVPPVFADAGPDAVSCLNGVPLSLEAATGGTWSGGSAQAAAGLLDAASGLVDPGLAGVGLHPYVLTLGSGTCLTRDTALVDVLALPALEVAATSAFCVNDTLVPLPDASPAGGQWSGAGWVPGSNPPTFDALIGAGVYDLAYTYTDEATGCTSQIPHQLTIFAPPTVLAGADLTLCNQPIVEQLTGASPVGAWGSTSTYYGLGLAAPAVTPNGEFDPSTTGTGSFAVVYAYTSAATGCTGRDTLAVTVSEPLIAEAGLDTVACLNAPLLQLEGFSPSSGGNWFAQLATDLPAIVDPATGLLNPQALAPGPHTFYFENGAGTCYTKDSLTVAIDPLPAVSIAADDVFCLNDSTVALAEATPAGGTWEGPGVAGTAFSTLVGAGSYALAYWFEDPATGCRDTAQHAVTVQPLPFLEAGPDLTLCNQPIPEALTGFTPPLAGPDGVGTFYGLGGAASAVTASGEFDPAASGEGTFEVVYAFTSALTNCTDRDTLEVTVVPPVVAWAGSDTVVCANAPLLELAGFSPASGGTWSGAGSAASAVLDAVAGVINPQTLAPGTYTFLLEVGSGTCYSADEVQVVVDPLPVLALDGADAFCLNDTLMPLAAATPVGGTWEGPGVVGNDFETLIGAGAYEVVYWYEEPATGCRDTVVHEVLVQALPVVAAGPDLVLCDQPIVEVLAGYAPGLSEAGNGAFYGLGGAAAATTAGGVFSPVDAGVGTFEVVYAFTADATGCANTDTLEVVVNPPVVAEAGLDSVVCANAPLLQLDGFSPLLGVQWFSTDPVANAAVVSAGSGVLAPSSLSPGNYVFSVEYGAGTCYSRDSLSITVLGLPELELGAPDAWCGYEGEEVVAPALPEGGTWFGQGILDPATGAFDTGQLAADYAPGYTFTDPVTGCADTAFHQVTLHPVPEAAFTADALGCTNGALPLAQESTGANAAFWWLGDGNVSYAWEPQHTFADPGFYTVAMEASNALGCKDTVEQVVQITVPPTASATLSPNAGCGPLTVAFTNGSEAPFSTFLWHIGASTTTTAYAPADMTFEPGDTLVEVPVSLTAENLCGTSVFADTVQVFPAPALSFALLQDTACSPFALELLNTSVGMPDALVWDLGNGSSYDGFQPPATWYTTGDTPQDFSIVLVGENECGTDTAAAVFHLLPNTVSAFFDASTQSGCAPLEVDFTDLSANATAITFDFGNGLVSFESLASTTFEDPGIYTVQQFVTNGCAYDTVGLAVEVFEEPEFTLSTNAVSYCVDEPVNFTVQSATSGSADWAFGNGAQGSGFFATTTYAAPGTYWAVAEVGTALFACTAEDSVQVIVNPSPVWDLSVPEPGCSPFEATFGNASLNTQFITWTYSDGSAPDVAWSPTHTFVNNTAEPVVYTVEVHAESSNFCAADTVLQVGVLPAPEALIVLGASASCEVPVELDVADASVGGISSTWWFGGQLVGAGGVPSITATAVGEHELVLSTVNAWGCADADTALFTVLASPVASLNVFPVVGCQILPVTFEDQSVGAASTQLELSSPSGVVYSGPLTGQALFNLEEPGLYLAQFTATSPDGCAVALDVPQLIQVHPTPVASFDAAPFIGTATDIDPLNDTWLFESTSVGASIWNWNFGDGTVASGPEVGHTYAGAGTYTVTLTAANAFGCADTRSDLVYTEALLQVFVPNAFTPPSAANSSQGTGSRGLNDGFRPVFSDPELVAEYELTIVNRWGEVVFHSFDPAAWWVGEAEEGSAHYAEDDVYVWTLYYQPTYADIGVAKKGHVVLIRD